MKFKFMDPSIIMSVVVALIILAVGIFAFFVTINEIPAEGEGHQVQIAINNASETANSVFNILGVVMVIGAIMTIVGLVYSYISPRRY